MRDGIGCDEIRSEEIRSNEIAATKSRSDRNWELKLKIETKKIEGRSL